MGNLVEQIKEKTKELNGLIKQAESEGLIVELGHNAPYGNGEMSDTVKIKILKEL